MKRTLKVFLGDSAIEVGLLHYSAQGRRESALFEYTRGWLESNDRFPLEPELPLVVGPQFHKKKSTGSLFHGVIADTEPDGWGRRVILRDHAKMRKMEKKGESVLAPPLCEIDFLLAVDDFSRIGALRFQDEQGIFQRSPQDGKRTTPPLVELRQLLVASRNVERGDETAEDLEFLRGRGTSVGGLRPKCTILDKKGRLSIGKFPSIKDDRAVTKGEVLAMRLAKKAGLNVAESQLVNSDGIPVAIISRFDRGLDGKRILYASAATLLGVDPEDPTDHSYTELVDLIRITGAEAQVDIEELWRRIAFSILITNVDDHLRNHGFLHVTKGQWRLSPAFDLNPFPERVRELKTWISEETGPQATIEALMEVIPYFRISTARARELLGTVEKAVSTWRKEGKSIGMTKGELASFEEAFEHSERDHAKTEAGKR